VSVEVKYALDVAPQGSTSWSVTAEPSVVGERPAIRISLTEEVRRGTPGVDFIDRPTFLVVPTQLAAGRVEVDLVSDLLPDAPEYARGFAGIAFGLAEDRSSFEAVYVRPYNGLFVAPDELRRQRAIQYFAYPDWPFDRLREERPNEGFESAVDIAPSRWCHLLVEFGLDHVRAEVDGVEVVNRARLGRAVGDGLGLFVDIGTDAAFSSLVISGE
jgi:hypothetical protein